MIFLFLIVLKNVFAIDYRYYINSCSRNSGITNCNLLYDRNWGTYIDLTDDGGNDIITLNFNQSINLADFLFVSEHRLSVYDHTLDCYIDSTLMYHYVDNSESWCSSAVGLDNFSVPVSALCNKIIWNIQEGCCEHYSYSGCGMPTYKSVQLYEVLHGENTSYYSTNYTLPYGNFIFNDSTICINKTKGYAELYFTKNFTSDYAIYYSFNNFQIFSENTIYLQEFFHYISTDSPECSGNYDFFTSDYFATNETYVTSDLENNIYALLKHQNILYFVAESLPYRCNKFLKVPSQISKIRFQNKYNLPHYAFFEIGMYYPINNINVTFKFYDATENLIDTIDSVLLSNNTLDIYLNGFYNGSVAFNISKEWFIVATYNTTGNIATYNFVQNAVYFLNLTENKAINGFKSVDVIPDLTFVFLEDRYFLVDLVLIQGISEDYIPSWSLTLDSPILLNTGGVYNLEFYVTDEFHKNVNIYDTYDHYVTVTSDCELWIQNDIKEISDELTSNAIGSLKTSFSSLCFAFDNNTLHLQGFSFCKVLIWGYSILCIVLGCIVYVLFKSFVGGLATFSGLAMLGTFILPLQPLYLIWLAVIFTISCASLIVKVVTSSGGSNE